MLPLLMVTEMMILLKLMLLPLALAHCTYDLHILQEFGWQDVIVLI